MYSLPFRLRLFLLLFPWAAPAIALETSHREWINPSREGSGIWLRNRQAWPLKVEALRIRNTGLITFDLVTMKAGTRLHVFRVGQGKGKWLPLTPVGKRGIKVAARDSLLISGFALADSTARPSGTAGTEASALSAYASHAAYSLDLKLVDNAGETCRVRITETAPDYSIPGAAGMAEVAESALPDD